MRGAMKSHDGGGVGVTVGEEVAVRVGVGGRVGVRVAVRVAVGENVGSGVTVRVTVAVAVGGRVAVAVGSDGNVRVAVGRGVAVCVGVDGGGVAVGAAAVVGVGSGSAGRQVHPESSGSGWHTSVVPGHTPPHMRGAMKPQGQPVREVFTAVMISLIVTLPS